MIIVLLISVVWEAFTFFAFPKQAFVQALLESWFVTKGLIFQKDFSATYLPFLRFIMVPYHQIFGFSQHSTVVLALLSSLFVLFCLFLVSRRWFTGYARYLPMLFYALWIPSVGQNLFAGTAFVGITLFLGWIFWLEWHRKPLKILLFLSGLFIGMGLFTMQMTLIFVLIVWLSLFFSKNLLKEKIVNAFIFSCGVAVPGIISIAWVAFQGDLLGLLDWAVSYHLKYYPFSNLGRDPQVLMLFFAIHSPLLIYLVSSKKLKDKLFILLAALSLPLVFWFAIFHPQRFAISLPIYSLLLGMAIESLNTRIVRLQLFPKLAVITFIILNVLAIGFYFVPRYWQYIIKPQPALVTSALYPKDPMADAVNWINIQTPDNSKILVIGDSLFYFEAQRVPANPRASLASEPYVFLPFEQFVNEIVAKPPDYWVVDTRMFDRYPTFGFPTMGNNFKKIIDCQTFLVKFDYWTISQYNSRTKACIANIEFE